ncbi:MAG: diaminopimelate decarboxylase [Methanosarcinales archaeon]|nr:MAG: diaminopimelate decarboxylase [Methanosarcinales archaeon]
MSIISDHLGIRNHHLTIGGVDTVSLTQKYGTPLYVLDEDRVRRNFRTFRGAFPDADLYYAAKANWNLSILRIIASEGAGADVFSDGELYAALLAGIPPERILFNGNSKTLNELQMAVDTGVRVSMDSLHELYALSDLAVKSGKTVDVAFRVNPDVSPDTHPKIATGLAASKFGIGYADVVEAYKEAKKLGGVRPVGIHCHIGSQILDVAPFGEAVEKMMDMVEQITRLGVDLKFVDLGGGLGIPYQEGMEAPEPRDLAGAVLPTFNERSKSIGIAPKLILEPGRYIVGDAGVLLTGVNTVKKAAKTFVGVDSGLNLLIRPAMYDAYHEVVVANKADVAGTETYDVVGPICESGDVIAKDRELPSVEPGDVVAVLDVGAYGFSMSSQYNGRCRCAEVLISAGGVDLIRGQESYGDLLAKQVLPARLL